MKTNRELATEIYEALNKKGAGLGNVSIHIIEKTLNENLKDLTEVASSILEDDIENGILKPRDRVKLKKLKLKN